MLKNRRPTTATLPWPDRSFDNWDTSKLGRVENEAKKNWKGKWMMIMEDFILVPLKCWTIDILWDNYRSRIVSYFFSPSLFFLLLLCASEAVRQTGRTVFGREVIVECPMIQGNHLSWRIESISFFLRLLVQPATYLMPHWARKCTTRNYFCTLWARLSCNGPFSSFFFGWSHRYFNYDSLLLELTHYYGLIPVIWAAHDLDRRKAMAAVFILVEPRSSQWPQGFGDGREKIPGLLL